MSQSFLATKPYKGTRDFYPEEMRLRKWFFGKMREVAEAFGYEEYGGPILEAFDLYAAKSGQELVNEQIYHFEDKGKRHLAIRPEMTPTVARMVAAKHNEMTFPLRWYCIANLMRYERPQKGRLREHWQLNMDLFGESGVHADLEILTVIPRLLRAFGADSSMFRIKVSNRRFFNEVLADVLQVGDSEIHAISKAVDKRAKISEEDYRKWLNDSGIADEKIQTLDEIFNSSLDELIGRMKGDSRGASEMRELMELIDAMGLSDVCQFDFTIVRGFDYYTGAVFEVEDVSPENRRALFGGGRYDDLIGLFRKSDISGIGFGFGDVTFYDFLKTHNLLPEELRDRQKVLIATFEEVPYAEYAKLSQLLHDRGIANNVYLDPSTKLKKQFAYAEKMDYAAVLLMGDEELKQGQVSLKDLANREQTTVDREDCIRRLKEML
ncbi:MAG: histidine--tRNA ligase [Candidatus Sumerlaeia bacterium]